MIYFWMFLTDLQINVETNGREVEIGSIWDLQSYTRPDIFHLFVLVLLHIGPVQLHD